MGKTIPPKSPLSSLLSAPKFSNLLNRALESCRKIIRQKFFKLACQHEKRKTTGHVVALYAAQCGECSKWRVLPTQEDFEDIRSRFIEDPFFCNKKANVSCKDPADIEYDDTRIWAIDKPNLPKTPAGFQRVLLLRKDLSRMDAYYVTPAGKKEKTLSGVASFLEANPGFKGVSISDFSFVAPKVMDDTIPDDFERKGFSGGHKSIKELRDGDDDV